MTRTALLSLLLIGAYLVPACRKRTAPTTPPAQDAAAPAQSEAPQAAPTTPTLAVSAPPASKASAAPASKFNYVPGNTEFDDLTKHLAWFVISKKRFPENVDELLTANRLPKPVLPPGGQLVINQKAKTVDYVGPR